MKTSGRAHTLKYITEAAIAVQLRLEAAQILHDTNIRGVESETIEVLVQARCGLVAEGRAEDLRRV